MSELKERIELAKSGDQRQMKYLLEELKPMASRVASRYKVRESQDHDDLEQEAMLAGHKAIVKFDIDYGENFVDERFFAYARTSMEHAVICYLQQFDVVPVPRRLWQIRNIIELENPTNIEEFCEKYNISESRFYAAKSLIVGMGTQPRNVDFDTVRSDVLFDEESGMEDSVLYDKMKSLIDAQLDEFGEYFEQRDLSIFKSIFFGHKTPQEVSNEYDLCPSRVRYIVGQTLKNMKELMLDSGVTKEDIF
ncbi:sigma-70 family RNA polymerase sigma factor [Vibrio owensii]|uniref:sigma-70 family RNA polymerase sigma factor n=1 Tax=Vibrio owensii TaxID=696485 RepID=UPI0018F1A781|nr:sigma-70 family RNA polymerase sigma factor [Vibrio owensii]